MACAGWPPTVLARRWNPAHEPSPPDEIPTTEAVHALARECAERSRVWWREVEVLLVAYSGLRWGEHTALTVGQIDVDRRRITVDRQVVETRSALRESLPKGRRRRVTMYPAVTLGAPISPVLCDIEWTSSRTLQR